MELRHLRAFLEVADHGHFGHAAVELRLTQPALTQRVQALERELGVRLLSRTSRGVRLTAAGNVLIPFARNLVHLEDRALGILKDLKGGTAGRLRVAYLRYGDLAMAARIIAEFRKRHPAVELDTISGYTYGNYELLGRGEVDVAFVLTSGDKPDAVSTQAIGRDHLVLAVREDHALARLDPVPVSALRGRPMILFPSSLSPRFTSSLRRFLTKHLGEAPNVLAEEPSDLAVESVAKTGVAVTLVSGRRAASVLVPGIVYRRLVPAPVFEVGVASVRDDPTPAVANLMLVIDELAGFQVGPLGEDEELLER
jgi:DNA-binding transcriptional LysR family regulator